MKHQITSVQKIQGPIFSQIRSDQTGAGWIVGAYGVTYADGKWIVHEHYAFETQQEALAQTDELRGKLA